MSIENWIAFVLASMVLTMTPGPSILLGVVHSVNYGVKKTMYTALGDITANCIQMILVAVGLGVVIASSDMAFQAIKWFGVITLVYMGLKMVLAKPASVEVMQQVTSSRGRLFINGFIVAAGNPKAIVFFTAFFPQFIDPSQPLLQQMLIMCPTMALLDFTWVMIYAMTAKRFLGFMQTRPRLLNRVGGSSLLGASCFLAFSNR
ncbi:LysE family translocator [Photobacterium profundum]|nr:LysE family translocator [Photobacterium profundum]PSV57867.1 LysE family translocator [Photobacterium profundum]